MKIIKKIYMKIIILMVAIYAICTIASQQKVLNQYNQDKVELSKKIEEQEQTKEELIKRKEDVNSLDFIEQVAREKLDMYYPNERVYVDSGM